MSRLNLPSVHKLAKTLLGDHERMAHFELIYEIMGDLIPSDPLLGDSEAGFCPEHFAGLVLTDDSVVIASLSYAFGRHISEDVDLLAVMECVPGVPVEDNEKLNLIARSTARVVVAVAAQKKNGDVVARLYRHPGLERHEAAGFIKSAAEKARQFLALAQGNIGS